MGDLPVQFRKLTYENVRVSIAANRTPVVEVVGKLTITAHKEIGFQTRPSQTVVTASSTISS